ncbi:MAG: hypothetical protein NVS9B10_28030 [Nevskia sp.]
MSAEIIGIVILVVVLIAGPFAALRAVSYYRGRRPAAEATPRPAAKAADDEENPDDKRGFW